MFKPEKWDEPITITRGEFLREIVMAGVIGSLLTIVLLYLTGKA